MNQRREDVIKIDLGDVTLCLTARVRGLPRPPRLLWHVGVTRPTSAADRVIKPPPYAPTPKGVDLVMDLQADMQVPLAVQFTDEVGNPVMPPTGASIVYTVDDPTIINLTDNGDGTAMAAAAGTLGVANVHVDVSWNGVTLGGDLQINVVAGLAERVNIVAGTPEEVTPDTPGPAAPTGLAASAGSGSATLTWNTASDAASYTVKRAPAAGGPYGVVVTGVAATTFTDTGLTAGITYWYVVSATDAGGVESANSTEVSVTPTA